MCLSGQPNVIYAIMNPVVPLSALNPYDSSQKMKNQSFIFSNKAFVILPSIVSFWPNLPSFILLEFNYFNLLSFELPLSNLSYIDLLKFWAPFTY